MKYTFYYVLLVLLNLINTAKSDQQWVAPTTWTPEGSSIVYGTPGKGLWHIGANEEDPNISRVKDFVTLNGLYHNKVHPWLWTNKISAEIVWHMTGSAEALNQELSKIERGNMPAWVWESASKKPCSISILVKKDGSGHFVMTQDGQPIASGRVVTAADIKVRLATGSYKISSKAEKVGDDGRKFVWSKEHKCKMDYGMCIEPKRGIFLHGRDTGEDARSHGCYGISRAIAPFVFSHVVEGTEISISNE